MTALIIANTQIRCDSAGRYCLNDLHQASGGHKRHQPANWLRLDQTAELIAELQKPTESEEGLLTSEERSTHMPVVTIEGGLVQGTYALKELVYAYAMWISAKFHLHVIRAYDAMVTGQQAEAIPGLLPGPQHRADQLVGAGRIFTAALRTARALRMPPRRAMRAAFECVKRHAGIDWEEELGAADLVEEAASEADDMAAAISAWMVDHDLVSGREIIAGCHLGDPDDRALQMRVAEVMRSLGYRRGRPGRGGRQSGAWLWRRVLNA